MTDQPTETGTPPAAEDGQVTDAAEGGTGDPTVHQLAEKVDRLGHMLEQLLEGGGAKAEAEAPDIKAEVRAAVREVQAKEKQKVAAEEHAQSIEERIGKLEHKTENKPMEYKRATNFLGWTKP